MTTHKGRDARVEMSGDGGKTWETISVGRVSTSGQVFYPGVPVLPVFLDAERFGEKLAAVGYSFERITHAFEHAAIDVAEFSRIHASIVKANGNSQQRRKARRAYVRWLSSAIERTNRR